MTDKHVTVLHPPAGGAALTDYAPLLDKLGLSYQPIFPYFQVGEITSVQGWILHISVVKTRMAALLQAVLPVLKAAGTPFKIPVNYETGDHLLSGLLGAHQLGKIICIYPESPQQAVELARTLIPLSTSFPGPRILTDAHLGGNVYTRYGAFNPVMASDEQGQPVKLIHNKKGELVPDQYHIPFQQPRGITWPFTSIAQPEKPATGKLIRRRYLSLQPLKHDVKGSVIKGISLSSWRNIQWCIIKQGRKHMSSDDHGRDVRERLYWQHTLHQQLHGIIPLPAVYDIFEWKGDTYLVMELINGTSLSEYTIQAFSGRNWPLLAPDIQQTLLNYLLQIIAAVGQLHQRGIIHRDLNPENFIISERGIIYLIDVELAWQQGGEPPFTLGTAGYMSPEQRAVQTPTVYEDIYGLGGLMIKIFTGISPTRFDIDQPDTLGDKLDILIQDPVLSRLITACLQTAPDQRPALSTIRATLENYRPGTANGQSSPVTTAGTLVQQAINGIASQRLSNSDQIWFSKTSNEEKQVANAEINIVYDVSWKNGTCGILHLLSNVAQSGADLSKVLTQYQKNFAFLQQHFLPNITEFPPGYFHGAAGIGVTLAAGIHAGLLPTETAGYIRQCFQHQSEHLNIADGVAGQGLALLQCQAFMPTAQVNSLLQQYAAALLQQQQADGSWLLKKDHTQRKGVAMTGLSYGISGIICFLLEYGFRYGDTAAQESAFKGLTWLMKQSHVINGNTSWYIHPKNKNTEPWLNFGFTGIALAFIKAYEYTRDETYKAIVVSTLGQHPEQLMSIAVTMGDGVAGIGEIYLEAYRVFEEEIWKEKAGWLVKLLSTMTIRHDDQSVFWFTDETNIPTAGFMTGNSGIVHFLTRYHFYHKNIFPLFFK